LLSNKYHAKGEKKPKPALTPLIPDDLMRKKAKERNSPSGNLKMGEWSLKKQSHTSSHHEKEPRSSLYKDEKKDRGNRTWRTSTAGTYKQQF
jgi:hypothetical protein